MKVELIVKKKLFHSNGYGIYSCQPLKEYEKDLELHHIYKNFTIKGNIPELTIGNKYEFELGDIERSPKGNSYPVESFKMTLSSSSEDQYKFLESIITKKQFEAICEVFPKSSGIKIIDEIKNKTIDLTIVNGIKFQTVGKIIQKIAHNEEKAHLVSELSPLGISLNTIETIIKHYGDAQQAINRIKDSFYNLCEVRGLGFATVDKYALKNGEDLKSVKRLEACINYHIHEFANYGHSWTSKEEMLKVLNKTLKISEEDILNVLQKIKKDQNTNVLVLEDGRFTSKHYYEQEKSILEDLIRIDKNFKKEENLEIDSYIRLAENKLKITYTEEQRETIIESLSHGVYKINGKGGTGKSQIIKAITTICEETEKSYKAIALSGRAAQLLSLKEIDASTIHRALGYGQNGFEFNEHNKMPYDVVILEESSMVNASLWNSILKALKDGCQFIIVGDSGQLSGIGNGDVLRDLLRDTNFHGKELEKIHRQAEGSGIIEIASLIREGRNFVDFISEHDFNYENKLFFNHYGKDSDISLITFKETQELADNAYSIIKQKIEAIKNDSEDDIMDFQILVTNKERGNISALAVNEFCQKILDLPKKNKVSNSKYTFLKGDKVIVSGNKYKTKMYESAKDYAFGNPITISVENEDGEIEEVVKEVSLFNGTMGIVESLKEIKNEESVLVKFEGHAGYIAIEKEDLNSLELAYAITVHRSQGMSIKNVLTLLDFSAYKLLSRQLVYTAITRASKKSVLVAQHNALFNAIKNDASGIRRTFLEEMLKNIN